MPIGIIASGGKKRGHVYVMFPSIIVELKSCNREPQLLMVPNGTVCPHPGKELHALEIPWYLTWRPVYSHQNIEFP